MVENIRENDDPSWEDWKLATKEIYKMAFYMDEQLLVDTGMINCVVISCASAKTALALAYCLRMREMRSVIALTSAEHVGFVRAADLYHEVFTYEEVESLPNDRTLVYMDFKCDGELKQVITKRMGTHLMYSILVGPAVFQKKAAEHVFEKRSRDVLFDESSWRERRRLVAEVTKTGRDEKLRYSYKSFVEHMSRIVQLRSVRGPSQFVEAYETIYRNAASPSEALICSLDVDTGDDAEVDEGCANAALAS